jgi:hypothetical protein
MQVSGYRCLLFISLILFSASRLSAQTDTIIFNFGVNTDSNQNQSFEIKGTVTSSANEEAIIGALIQIDNLNATVTDVQGAFIIKLSYGYHILHISSLGFVTKIYRIGVFENGNLNIKLEEQSIALKTIEISANANNHLKNSIGLEILDVSKLEKQSKFLGELDVLRSLQSVSGVSSIGEGSSGINVRGGNADENLILQDQHLILNPTHALGIFSLTHPDLIESISLHKGDMPARYGGRLSSVLDIKLKEGNLVKFSGNAGVGIATSKITLEGPLVKNKISFIIGLRGSYLDWLLKQSKNINLQKSHAFFYDGTVKVDARLAKNTKAGISFFNSQDDFQFTDEVKFAYRTTSVVAYLNQIINKTSNLNISTNKGEYRSNLFDIKSNDQSKFTNTISYLRNKLAIQNQLNPSYFIEGGVELNTYKILPGSIEPYGTNSNIGTTELPVEQAKEIALYFDQKINITKSLLINLGLRHTFYSNIGAGRVTIYDDGKPKTAENIQDTLVFTAGQTIKKYSGLEPRFSFSYQLTSGTAIKGGYSRSYQYLNLLSNTSSASPTDLWQLSNYNISPQSANSFSLGYFNKRENKKYEFYVSGFYKNIQQSIDYRDFAKVLLNKNIETDLVRGLGKAFGVESFYAIKKEKSTIEINYTYTRALKKIEPSDIQVGINRGAWYASNYDKPHTLNFNYFLKTGRKTNFTTNFTYSSGRPTTAPIGVYNQENILDIPLYSSRNQYRIPSYHRLDIAYSIGPWGKKSLKHSLTLSIYNLYSNNNAFSVFFRQNAFLQTQAYRISVIGAAFPSINYQIKF